MVVSVDTWKPEVARAVLAEGAHLINDVSGLRDIDLAVACAESGAGIVLMHTRAAPKRKEFPHYDDVVADVVAFLRERMATAIDVGVDVDGIVLDPGPDFAKTPAQTIEVLSHLDAVVEPRPAGPAGGLAQGLRRCPDAAAAAWARRRHARCGCRRRRPWRLDRARPRRRRRARLPHGARRPARRRPVDPNLTLPIELRKAAADLMGGQAERGRTVAVVRRHSADQPASGVAMFTQPLEEAIASTRSVLGNITPDQLDDATPCASWKVRDVINHVVGTQHYFRGALTGTPPGWRRPGIGRLRVGVRRGDRRLVGGLSGRRRRRAGLITLPFGEIPGAAVAGMAATDTLTHGWDLARATGQRTDLAPDLAADTARQRRDEHPRTRSGGPTAKARSARSRRRPRTPPTPTGSPRSSDGTV